MVAAVSEINRLTLCVIQCIEGLNPKIQTADDFANLFTIKPNAFCILCYLYNL